MLGELGKFVGASQPQTRAPRCGSSLPLTPQANAGSLYRCSRSTYEQPVSHDRWKRGCNPSKTIFAGVSQTRFGGVSVDGASMSVRVHGDPGEVVTVTAAVPKTRLLNTRGGLVF